MIKYSLINFSISDLCGLIKLQTIRLGWTRQEMGKFCHALTGKTEAKLYTKADWIKCIRILDPINSSDSFADVRRRYGLLRK